MKTKGLHHISVTVGHAQEVVDFYSGVLGFRLIKKTVNYEDSNTYHISFSNQNVDAGSILTFFAMPDHKLGVKGLGQTTSIILEVPNDSFNFWIKRLNSFGIEVHKTYRFNETYLTFLDPFGVEIQLFEGDNQNLNDITFNGITKEVSIKGVKGVILKSKNINETVNFLNNDLGINLVERKDYFIRFKTDAIFGNTIDIDTTPTVEGSLGYGMIHHIAFRSENEDIDKWTEHLSKYKLTKIKDRKYFKAVYLREPGGAIVEISTDGPGFTVDEPKEALGTNLMVPDHFIDLADKINELYPIFVNEVKELKKYKYNDKTSYEAMILHQNMLNRINELAKKSKNEGLSEVEKEEQQLLRQKYAKSIASGFKNMIERIEVINDDDQSYRFVKKEEKYNA